MRRINTESVNKNQDESASDRVTVQITNSHPVTLLRTRSTPDKYSHTTRSGSWRGTLSLLPR